MCETNSVHRSRKLRNALSFYIPAVGADEEIDVDHGIVDVFAFQEALLLEAVLGIAFLTMLWVGFRRWLQYKEKIGRLHIEHVEARLRALEQIVADRDVQPAAQLGALPPEPLLKSDEAHPKPAG